MSIGKILKLRIKRSYNGKKPKDRSCCINELNAILEEAKKNFESTSEKQKEKIVEKIKADPEGFSKSRVFEDLRKDLGMYEA